MKRIIILPILTIVLFSCTDNKVVNNLKNELSLVKQKRDSLQNVVNNSKAKSRNKTASFLTFQNGDAENAMNFYLSLFDDSKLIELKRWEKESPGKEGTIMQATFSLNDHLFMCSDSPIKHEWGFTPAVSNYVECNNEQELKELFSKLSDKGQVLMPLNNYGFSKKFGFVVDQFGVSWQLNLQ